VQVTISPAQVISRVLAVLLLAVPLVWISSAMSNAEQELIARLSHKELLEYLQEGQVRSFGEQYLYVGGATLLYLALVEGVAGVLRLGMRLLRPTSTLAPARTTGY